jgi:hypothetical protein
MRRLITWIVVSFGIAAIVKRLRRRERQDELAAPPEEPEEPDDPAAELRQKLADSRADEEEPAEPPLSPEGSVDERRASVHEQGRAAVNEMRGPDSE